MAMSLLKGTGKFNREDHVTMFNANIKSCDENGIVYDEETPKWVPFGEDNDEITRELNNETDTKKNVLGKINVDHTAGANTTEIDPIAIRGNDELSAILYMMFKYQLVGDKAKLQCCEVTLADEQTDGSYGAFTESAIVDLKSWGGNTSKLSGPITLNWLGDREHGTFSAKTKTFTKTTSA
jgi:hypothetical protein